MATGKVTVVQINNMQGNFDEVERLFLFIGTTDDAATLHDVIPVSAQSDLDDLFGAGTSELKTQITAARNNAMNDNWACYAVGIEAADDWKEIVYAVLEQPHDLNVEAVILCTPVESKAEVEACQTCANECISRYAKFVTVHAAVSGIDAATETWADYQTRIGALVADVAADRVALVLQLHGNNLGIVAGRLCNPAVTVADTPMRVATGALSGLGPAPVDSADAPLTTALITSMAAARFSVPQWYAGYPGVYWADHALLDVDGGDYQVYENRRVLDYLARRVRVLAIGRIADRRLNSTARSISANETYFTRPLREAARPVEIAGLEMPAMIQPPESNAIDISWLSNTSVAVAITATPYNCPKSITMYLGLDLSA